jgi:hypothetical protein
MMIMKEHCTSHLLWGEHAQCGADLHAQSPDAAHHLQHTLPLSLAHLCRAHHAVCPSSQAAKQRSYMQTWEGPRHAAPMQKRVLPASLALRAACSKA